MLMTLRFHLSGFGHTQRNCGYAPRCVACGGAHFTGGCSTPREQPQCCGCGGKYTASYRGCIKWKEARAALAKRAPEGVRKSAATSQSPAPKPSGQGHLRSRRTWARAGITSSEGGALSRPPSLQILNPLESRSALSAERLSDTLTEVFRDFPQL